MKNAALILMLGLFGACSSVTAPSSVQILRDEYGVPHLYADDVYGLYYGYGYAIAQDRLFQLEMARRSTQGTVAEVLGEAYLNYDRNVRRHFSPESIRSQLAALGKKDSDVFDGYATGLNAWLAEVRANPDELLPKQFIDLDFTPRDWTPYDIAMIFIGTMNNRYGDFNTELENATILDALVLKHGDIAGRELFDLLNPRFTDHAPTTIPREDWNRQAPDSLAWADSGRAPLLHVSNAATTPVAVGFSNCFVLGRDKVSGANSILINGPQFGWFNPAYVYSVGMHGAGIDVVGNSPFGYPVIMFGHNSSISWGSTWGASDIVDIYAEELKSGDAGKYRYKGEFIELEHRVERLRVRDSDDVELDVYRSVHGPIVHRQDGVAFAKKRAWDGRELETLLSWLYASWADDFTEWKAQAEVSAINVNLYFADVDGNIGYFHGGRFPQRVAGHDNRLPARGDGSMDWQGRQPLDLANPHVLNPVAGYLANWNNKPGQGAMNPDFFFYSWSTADRVEILHDALSSRERFTADEAWSILQSSSYADVHAAWFLPRIDAALLETGNPVLADANQILQNWSGQSQDVDGDGFYDEAATAIFRTFLSKLVERVLKDDLGAAYGFFSTTGYPTAQAPTGAGTNIQTGVKAIVEAFEGRAAFDVLNGESVDTVIESAMRAALTQLTTRKGQAPDSFRLPVASRPFLTKNFLGIPQAGEAELMSLPVEQNRGTENNMIVMSPGAIVGYEITPPGQSGFISPAGEKDEHYADQFDMYHRFEKKRMWFYRDDVDKHRVSETLLHY